MAIETVNIAGMSASRLILGSNPFSGFAHQRPETDDEMRHFFTTARIKQTLREAEQLGINTFIGRADHHIMRCLMEYWDEGGQIQWIAQTCPEIGSISRGLDNGIEGGAAACYVHGGQMDYLLASDQLDEVPAAIDKVRQAGLPVGIAGHNPEVFAWAEENLDVDFYLCSYYNSAHRDARAEHISGMAEWFNPQDRDIMVELIQRLSKPVIHYKVMAAGRNDPREALEFVARRLRPTDAVCIGVYPKDHPTMLEEDLHLLQESLQAI